MITGGIVACAIGVLVVALVGPGVVAAAAIGGGATLLGLLVGAALEGAL